jgi:uncharacterized protein
VSKCPSVKSDTLIRANEVSDDTAILFPLYSDTDMKIAIKVKTNAKENAVQEGPGGELRVLVKAPPQEGRANEAVIEALAAHFKVPKSRVAIVGGFKSKNKIVEIH